MTEAEWLACANIWTMLVFLHGKVSDRKLRLFAVACCSRVERHIRGERRRKPFLAIAERFADGMATEQELADTRRWFTTLCGGGESAWAYFGWETTFPDAWQAAHISQVQSSLLCEAMPHWRKKSRKTIWERIRRLGKTEIIALPIAERELQSQVLLVRDIFGNPFHPITLNPSWLTSTVVALANGIYNEKAFDRMPILADALQDAGCDNEDILNHLRGSGPHTKGCWCVDLILGKN